MHQSIRRLLLMAVAICVTVAAHNAPASPEPVTAETTAQPNVILIMADDLGYNDLSCYGSEKIRTPVLDQLADDGIRLTSFYAGATVCTPSRMSLLSGAYPARLGWRGGVVGYGMPRDSGLSTDVVTIAEVFKTAGYRTAMAGKWHIGGESLRPMHQGFDDTYYILNSNNMSRDLYRGEERLHQAFDNRRLTETFTQEAIRIIQSGAKQPFFLYLPFTAPHFPAKAHPDWDGRSNHGAYGDVVEELDDRIGQILEALEDQGLTDRTLIVFLSDNGPEPGQIRFASAAPFSGTKWSTREGGTRVPCIVRWPGVIEPGRTSDALIAAIDLYPTLARACGVSIALPEGAQKIDGVDVWDTLIDEDAEHARGDLLYWHGLGEATAIRRGQWKLFFGAGTKHGDDPDISGGPLLFNLADDPGETTDVSDEHPRIVQQLLELAKTQLQDIQQDLLPLGSDAPPPSSAEDRELQPKWGKWLR